MRIERLRKRAEFEFLTKQAAKHHCGAFVVQTFPNKLNIWRVGFTASKKVGGAVQRNRARRRLKGVVDKLMRLNPAFNGVPHDMVIVARTAAIDAPYATLISDLTTVLKKLKCAGV